MMMSDELTELKNELYDMNQELKAMKTFMEEMNYTVSIMPFHIGARDVAYRLERKLMAYVWKYCQSRPFHIVGLLNLKSFLSDPYSSHRNSVCGRQAEKAFQELSMVEINAIRKRLEKVLKKPNLMSDLAVLKASGDCDNAHAHGFPRNMTQDELIAFYYKVDQDDVGDALTTIFLIEEDFSFYFPEPKMQS